eukprot:scaffold37_cov172-Ochromonas_danica.AAC.5
MKIGVLPIFIRITQGAIFVSLIWFLSSSIWFLETGELVVDMTYFRIIYYTLMFFSSSRIVSCSVDSVSLARSCSNNVSDNLLTCPYLASFP